MFSTSSGNAAVDENPRSAASGCGAPESLLCVLERSDKHGTPAAERLGGAQSRLDLPAFVSCQLELSFACAYDDVGLLDNRLGDGRNAGRFRQARRQCMKASRPCRQSAVPRFTGAQRLFGLLALDELGVGARFQALGIGPRSFRGFMRPGSVDRLRRARAQRVQILVFVDGEFAGPFEVELKEGDNAPFDRDGKNQAGFLIPPGALGGPLGSIPVSGSRTT